MELDVRQWKQLYAQSPVANWWQSPEAYQMWLGAKQWVKPLLTYVMRGSELKGLILGYTTKSTCKLWDLFTCRTIVNGGPLLSNDIREEELAQLLHQTEEIVQNTTRSIYIELRLYADYSPWKEMFSRLQSQWNWIPHYDIHITCDSMEGVWQRMGEEKRRAVRKAQAEGFHIEVWQGDISQLDAWYGMLEQLYRHRVHRPLWPKAFIQHVLTCPSVKLLLQFRNNQLTGGVLCPMNDKCIYEWYISGDSTTTFVPIQYAINQHIPCFSLMGAGEPDVPYGVRDFKLRFGGELKLFGRYQRVMRPKVFAIGCCVIRCVDKWTQFRKQHTAK